MTVLINDADRDWALHALMMDCDQPKDRFYVEWDVMSRLYDLFKYGSGNAPEFTAEDNHPGK